MKILISRIKTVSLYRDNQGKDKGMRRKKIYSTVAYNGVEYTVYDALPKHDKVWVKMKNDFYIMDCYPNVGESLDEYFSRRGYKLRLLVDWGIV